MKPPNAPPERTPLRPADAAELFADLDSAEGNDAGNDTENDAEDGEAEDALGPQLDPPSLAPVRIDKWLWAARMAKTRTLASEACDAGHVKLNGHTAKASQKVKPGDKIEAFLPSGRRVLEVRGTAERRGSAPLARSLFTDLAPPVRAPKIEGVELDLGRGRPTKADRRKMERLRGW
jgi:ribosome-associated heat shock protein Hsp15